MDEQIQAIQGRRRRSRAEVEQLVAEYEASGMTRVEFCRRQALSLASLARYRKRQAQDSSRRADGWVAVEVRGAGPGPQGEGSSGLAVVVGGRRIHIGRGFDGPTLERLLGVLER